MLLAAGSRRSLLIQEGQAQVIVARRQVEGQAQRVAVADKLARLPPRKGVQAVHRVAAPQGQVAPLAREPDGDTPCLGHIRPGLPVQGQGQRLARAQVAAIAVGAEEQERVLPGRLLRSLDRGQHGGRGRRPFHGQRADRKGRAGHLARPVEHRHARIERRRKEAHVQHIVPRRRARRDGDLLPKGHHLARPPLRRGIVEKGLAPPVKAQVVDQVHENGPVALLDGALDLKIERHVEHLSRDDGRVQVIAPEGQRVAQVDLCLNLRRETGFLPKTRFLFRYPIRFIAHPAVRPQLAMEQRTGGQQALAEQRIDRRGVIIDQQRRATAGRRQDQRLAAHPADGLIVVRGHGQRGMLLEIGGHIGIGLRVGIEQPGRSDQRLVALVIGRGRRRPAVHIVPIRARALVGEEEKEQERA